MKEDLKNVADILLWPDWKAGEGKREQIFRRLERTLTSEELDELLEIIRENASTYAHRVKDVRLRLWGLHSSRHIKLRKP